ncbi:MAG: hypothetical protein PHQ36_01770 [Anaerolineales bacterium]|nr:hypothetical protein [Anaerolineales bacterium]
MAKKKATQQDWKNRIVGHGEKPAKDFLANPYNFRIHTAMQERALQGSLDTLGWIDDVIENVQTGHVIDGHDRIVLATRKGESTPVPYKQVDLTPEEEFQALLMLDPIAAMAQTDTDKLEQLLALTNTEDEKVMEFLANLAQKNNVAAPDFDEYDEDVASDVEMLTCPKCGHAFPK